VSGGNVLVTTDVQAGGNVSATSHTGTTVSVTGNVTGGNIRTAGVITATGNITGNYFIGNGSQLAGIDTSQIQNGNSNVRIASSAGNVSVNVNGVSPIALFTPVGATVVGNLSVTGNVIAPAVSGGAVTGTSLSVTGNVTGANVVATGNLYYNTTTKVTRSLTVGTRTSPVSIVLTDAGSFLVGTRSSGNVTVTTST
jgi:hypothetical protein